MNSLQAQRRRRKAKSRVFSTLLWLFGSVVPAVCQTPAPTTDDPNLLQSRAIQTVDSFRSNVYRTGDMVSMLPAVRKAHDDLETSYSAFVAKGDQADAALSLLTMADIERMANIFSAMDQTSAADKYRKAIELSKGANRTDYEFKALAGLALTETNRNDLTSADQHALQALDLATATGNKPFQLRALDDLSDIEVKRGNFDAARSYIERAQAIAAEVPKSYEHYVHQLEVGDLYYKLGLGCDSLSKPQECSQLFEKARSAYEAGAAVARSFQYDYMAEIAKSFLQDLDLQQTLNAQQLAINARVAQAKGNTEIAESSLRAAITIQERSSKPDDSALVDSLVALADLLVTSNKTDEAVNLYNRALQITRKGQDLHREAQILSSLAQVDLNLARYDEAIVRLQEAAQIQRALADQSALATTLSTLGSVYEAEGKYQEALYEYMNSLTIRLKVFGPQSAVTANSLMDLAGVYYHTGRYGEAQVNYERALAELRGTLGDDQAEIATILNNLALVYQAQGNSDKAKDYLSRALEIRRRVLGGQHPETAATLNNLGTLDAHLGKYDEASSLFEEALAIDSKALGANHPTTKTIAANLADVRNMKKESPNSKKQN
jgi:tetratricopeptide (TPR) repeat protein